MKVYNLKENEMELRHELETIKDSVLPTGWTLWDKWFGGFQKGGLQFIAAPTGQGKTTLLLALAKRAVRQGYKVLYIGTEQPIVKLFEAIGPVDMDACRKESGDRFEDIIGDREYDVIIYDYLGAETAAYQDAQEWQIYRDQANWLSDYAIKNQVCILTAGQADTSILEKPLEALHSAKFVSFAKHIIDKVSSAVYIVRIQGKVYMSMIKNRYFSFVEDTPEICIDYARKEVMEAIL